MLVPEPRLHFRIKSLPGEMSSVRYWRMGTLPSLPLTLAPLTSSLQLRVVVVHSRPAGPWPRPRAALWEDRPPRRTQTGIPQFQWETTTAGLSMEIMANREAPGPHNCHCLSSTTHLAWQDNRNPLKSSGALHRENPPLRLWALRDFITRQKFESCSPMIRANCPAATLA